MPFKAISPWQNKIQIENRNYSMWESLFMCKTLEEYYEKRQWQQIGLQNTNYQPYVLNIVYSSIKIKLANIIYQRPQFLLTPMPGHGDWDPELAVRASLIKEGGLNTVLKHPKVHFVKNLRQCALDSFFRFGVGEVGYAADWQNPNKTPLLTSADENIEDEGEALDDVKVLQDIEVPLHERTYFKHIKARRFRADCPDDPILDHSNWCGYYSFIRKTVLAKTKGITLPKEIKSEFFSAGINQKFIKRSATVDVDKTDYIEDNAYYKVWRLWNNLSKKKNLVIETEGWPIIWEDRFERLPFPNVIWDERAPSIENAGFYPMPPVYQWISPQDEINQAREQIRNYRKRFVRKFWANKNVPVDEIQKLSNNKDGEVVILKGASTGDQAIGQISNPEIGVSIQGSIEISTADINIITGTSANARQQTDRTTATESKIIDVRAQIRESVEQMDFSQFACDIARETLLTMHERFSEPMWIQINADPALDQSQEVQDGLPVYEYISNQEITDGSYDWDIELNVINGTPAQQMEEKQKFFEFITFVMAQPEIAINPVLLYETARAIGYKNRRVIRALSEAATLKLVALQAAAAGKKGNGTKESMSGNTNPNPQNEIASQINQQMGG